ncbi:carbamoyltransferase [Mucilaginibacter sp. CSA2-8R]|uniref:carbamoyltransferase family protein n=1 Tax=Mucilaginibacter sp. CSA2-8R TaxID=3141542 RepID=UPI00315CB9E4
MYILGISSFYHDSAACILKDGILMAAAQEERFTRIKNDAAFPEKAIKYCLDYCNITLKEVQHIVFYEKPFLKFERLVETFFAFAPRGLTAYLKALPIWVKHKLFLKRVITKALKKITPDWVPGANTLLFTTHHQSHAASAFFPSPFEEALVLTLDGVGEWATTSVAVGSGKQLKMVREIRFPHSIGLLYSAFTYYLGFKVNCDEYKVMGLAPYGKPIFKLLIYEHLIDVKPDGSFRLNMHYFNYATGLTMTGRQFDQLLGQPRRKPAEALSQFHMDVAASIQQVTEEIMLKLALAMHSAYPHQNLCLAGGVALNCVANGRLLREGPFKNIWVQPAAGDAGGALGAAYYTWHQYHQQPRPANNTTDQMQQALLGPDYTPDDVKLAIDNAGLEYVTLPDDAFYTGVARLIAAGKVVGWFNGRMEFGPRALGARSILADPRHPEMQLVLNQKIKFRESFRPFAPAVLSDHQQEYFDLAKPSPYMLFTAPVAAKQRVDANESTSQTGLEALKTLRSTMPAVTHVDYSARLQTVTPEHTEFYRLIQAFYQLTGCPLLVNTSFNVMDEPIVCSPADAIRCFLSCNMDVLAFKNIVVYKPDSRPDYIVQNHQR